MKLCNLIRRIRLGEWDRLKENWAIGIGFHTSQTDRDAVGHANNGRPMQGNGDEIAGKRNANN